MRGSDRQPQPDWIDTMNTASQRARAVFLRPLLEGLTRLGITAHDITHGRMVMAVLGFVIFSGHQFLAVTLFGIALLLDACDGPLARFQNIASDRGKFLDMVSDHVTRTFIVFTFLTLGYDPFLVAYNIFILGAVYVLGIVKKNESTPTDWIIKPYPKLGYLPVIVVAPFFLLTLFSIDLIQEGLVISNVLATILSVYYLFVIQRRWRIASSKT